MPVTSIEWIGPAANDLHLIPGLTGPQLNQLVMVRRTEGDQRLDKIAAPITATIKANFTGAHPEVQVEPTGEIKVTALPAPPRLLDFLMIIEVKEGATTFNLYRRVVIHNAVTDLWLTPDPLTVRQGTTNMQFTLLAEFDDGTYGDLTTWCPPAPAAGADRAYVRATAAAATPIVGWTPIAGGPVTVDAATGVLTGVAAANDAAVVATVAAPVNRFATAPARAAAPWTTPVTISHLGGPGFGAIGGAANILILPDGFTDADRHDFERQAFKLVQALQTRRYTRPYDILGGSLNYFSAWVPSRQAGISALGPVRRFNIAGTQADAEEVDTAVPNDTAAINAAWTVGNPPIPATNDGFLINECDTAFGLTLAERPRAQRLQPIRVVTYRPARLTEASLDDLLKNLRVPGGATVGATWARGGKDQDRVMILTHTNRYGGGNSFRAGSGRLIASNLSDQNHHRIQDATAPQRGKDLVADPVPAGLELIAWVTAAHELAHSFTLSDEYGGGGPLPANRIAGLAAKANVQPRSTLLTGVNLDADKVKWRWPRIRTAGVTTGMPTPLGGNRWRVQLRPGHAASFARDDVVRFRLRQLLTAPAPSGRFIVTAVAVASDRVDLEQLFAGAFVPGTYPAGSVLMAPVRGPDPNAAGRVFGPDLELMHTTPRASMNTSHNPLNAGPGDLANRACVGGLATPTRATNFKPPVLVPNPPQYSSWIVGLYENGATFDCDVYRPTGVCLMRQTVFNDLAVGGQRAYQFCPVCRYAMVDLIDPSQHRWIDNDFAARYPV
jgi:hypothetical protein